jgi:hypothetical protein
MILALAFFIGCSDDDDPVTPALLEPVGLA